MLLYEWKTCDQLTRNVIFTPRVDIENCLPEELRNAIHGMSGHWKGEMGMEIEAGFATTAIEECLSKSKRASKQKAHDEFPGGPDSHLMGSLSETPP
jgi:hypothetical protein